LALEQQACGAELTMSRAGFAAHGFTEGFDTLDLKEAKTVLEELNGLLFNSI
jgi:hypothetical protein